MTTYTPTQFIDTVQGLKTSFVQTFIFDEKVSKPLQALIDTQTDFIKQLVKTTTDVTTTVFDNVVTETCKKVKAAK
jgi:hypothetical protein